MSVGWYVSSIICTFSHSDWLVLGWTVLDNRDNPKNDPKPERNGIAAVSSQRNSCSVWSPRKLSMTSRSTVGDFKVTVSEHTTSHGKKVHQDLLSYHLPHVLHSTHTCEPLNRRSGGSLCNCTDILLVLLDFMQPVQIAVSQDRIGPYSPYRVLTPLERSVPGVLPSAAAS